MTELSQLKRDFLRQDENGVEKWCNNLIICFKELNEIALAKFTAEKYTIQDARNQQKPTEYVQTITCHAKRADIESTYN